MNSQNLLYGVIGAVLGAAITYLIMDRLHESEIDDIYDEYEDAVAKMKANKAADDDSALDFPTTDGSEEDEQEPGVVEGEGIFAEGTELAKNVKVLRTTVEQSKKDYPTPPSMDKISGVVGGPGPVHLLATDAIHMDDVSSMVADEGIDSDEEAFEEETPDSDEEPAKIFIIEPDQVSGHQIICTYNHDDGSVEIAQAMSVKAGFDDIIENDALYSLIDEKAYDVLMSSDPQEEMRLLAVRNTLLNLDFVIRY